MNGKNLAIGLITVSFIFVISGGVSSFISGLKEDRVETYKRMENINSTFEDFSATVSIFESFRDELYGGVLKNVYYDTMYDTDSKVKEQLTNYESIVDDIEKYIKSFNKLCKDNYYPDKNINSKCLNYKTIYEQVNNYFVTDINLYNDIVDKYNSYQTSNNSNKIIKKYSITKKYIDYNNDKVYDGKEE